MQWSSLYGAELLKRKLVCLNRAWHRGFSSRQVGVSENIVTKHENIFFCVSFFMQVHESGFSIISHVHFCSFQCFQIFARVLATLGPVSATNCSQKYLAVEMTLSQIYAHCIAGVIDTVYFGPVSMTPLYLSCCWCCNSFVSGLVYTIVRIALVMKQCQQQQQVPWKDHLEKIWMQNHIVSNQNVKVSVLKN
jgi:hypothetical protein